MSQDVVVGDVVQINPDSDEVFGGCFLVVEEVNSWGFQGYCDMPGKDRGVIHYRVNRGDCSRILTELDALDPQPRGHEFERVTKWVLRLANGLSPD